MSTQGSVCGMNPNTGRVVIKTTHGYTVLNIERGIVGPRDVLTGRIQGLGKAVLINTSRDATEVSVSVEIIDAALDVARALLHEDAVEDLARGCAEGSGRA